MDKSVLGYFVRLVLHSNIVLWRLFRLLVFPDFVRTSPLGVVGSVSAGGMRVVTSNRRVSFGGYHRKRQYNASRDEMLGHTLCSTGEP